VTDHLGPLVCEQDECIGIGGDVRLEGNVQLRMPALWGFDAVTFFDAGMVWSDVSEVDLSEIQPSVGIGLRYETPVGPLRFDYARRLIDSPEFSSEPMNALHVGISEAF
jgi:outer membrane translocation and assembly module TamA